MRTERPNGAAAAGYGGVAVGFLVVLAALLGLLLGCESGPAVRQQPTATVEAKGDVQVDQPTISEIARDLSAHLDTVQGNLEQTLDHRLDEQRRILEETRIEKKHTETAVILGLLAAGGVLLLALNNPFPAWLVPYVIGASLVALFCLPALLLL